MPTVSVPARKISVASAASSLLLLHRTETTESCSTTAGQRVQREGFGYHPDANVLRLRAEHQPQRPARRTDTKVPDERPLAVPIQHADVLADVRSARGVLQHDPAPYLAQRLETPLLLGQWTASHFFGTSVSGDTLNVRRGM